MKSLLESLNWNGLNPIVRHRILLLINLNERVTLVVETSFRLLLWTFLPTYKAYNKKDQYKYYNNDY
jgi:hypothetical protein